MSDTNNTKKYYIPFPFKNKKEWKNGECKHLPDGEAEEIFPVAALEDITPEAIKKAADEALRECDKKGLCAARDALAKRLGFGQYCKIKEEEKRMKAFMEEHGLKTKADLLAPRIFEKRLFRLSHRELADKILLTNEEKYPEELKNLEVSRDVQKCADQKCDESQKRLNSYKELYKEYQQFYSAIKENQQEHVTLSGYVAYPYPHKEWIEELDYCKMELGEIYDHQSGYVMRSGYVAYPYPHKEWIEAWNYYEMELGEKWFCLPKEEEEKKLRESALAYAEDKEAKFNERLQRFKKDSHRTKIKRIFTGYNVASENERSIMPLHFMSPPPMAP